MVRVTAVLAVCDDCNVRVSVGVSDVSLSRQPGALSGARAHSQHQHQHHLITSPAHQLTSSLSQHKTTFYILILSLSLSLPSCWTNPKIVTVEATCPLIDCLIMRAKPSPTLSVLSLSLTDIMSLFSVDVGSQS